MIGVRKPRHLSAGILFIIVSAVCFTLVKDLSFGTSRNMGPGYFPMALTIILFALGLIVTAQSLLGRAEAEPRASTERDIMQGIRALVAVLGSLVVFGLLVRPVGLATAIFLSVLVGSRGMRIYPLRTAILLALGLSAVCCLAFVALLGLPIPLFGIILGW
jgi:hypothetical protein